MSPRADDLSAAVAAILAGEGPAEPPPGFASGSTATANLRSIARSLEGVEAAPVLVAHLAAAALETPDPDTALNRLEQFLAFHESPAIIARELDADPQARWRQVIVHRKGATPAGAGILGIIPGFPVKSLRCHLQ